MRLVHFVSAREQVEAASDKDYVFKSSRSDDALVKAQYIEDMSFSIKKLARLLTGLVNVCAVSAAIAGDAATDTTTGTAVQPVAESLDVQFLRHTMEAGDLEVADAVRTALTELDQQFIRDQIKGHETASVSLRAQSATSEDERLRAFAKDAMPILERHLRSLRKLLP